MFEHEVSVDSLPILSTYIFSFPFNGRGIAVQSWGLTLPQHFLPCPHYSVYAESEVLYTNILSKKCQILVIILQK